MNGGQRLGLAPNAGTKSAGLWADIIRGISNPAAGAGVPPRPKLQKKKDAGQALRLHDVAQAIHAKANQ